MPRPRWWFGVVGLVVVAGALLRGQPSGSESGEAVPDVLLTALLEGETDTALRHLDELQSTRTDELDFWTYLRGVAHYQAGQHREALATLESLAANHPDSRWGTKAGALRAECHRRLGQHEQAAALYEARAHDLLSASRKAELADIYLGFADELSTEPATPSPDAPPVDYTRAATLYGKVLELGAPASADDHALERMSYCWFRLQNWPVALQAIDRYLQRFHPGLPGADEHTTWGLHVLPVLLRKAECQQNSGQPQAARVTLEDLLALIEAARSRAGAYADFPWSALEEAGLDARRLEGDALYALAHTYASDSPTEVPLAVAALRRFLDAFPAHPRSVRAAFEIGPLFHNIGRDEDALAALEAFLDSPPAALDEAEAQQEAVELEMRARFVRGEILAGQGYFAQAIQAYQDYITRHPSGPDWAAAQQAILDTEYRIGQSHRQDGLYARAREAWQGFLDRYPLEPRAQDVMVSIGELFYEEAQALAKDTPADDPTLRPRQVALYEAALTQWQGVLGKYPGTDAASQAQCRTGELLESHLGRLPQAIDAYRACNFGSWSGRAAQHLARMIRPSLGVLTERSFRTGEAARIKLQTRNVEEVEVQLYALDLEAYFRKHLTNRRVEELDLDLISPDRAFRVALDDYAAYRPLEQEIPLGDDGPRVLAVAVTAGELRATTLVVQSDVDVIVKSSRRELFVFAQNRSTGQPEPDVAVLAGLRVGADHGTRFHSLVTNADGVARLKDDELADSDGLQVFASKAGHCAVEGLNLQGLGLATGLSPRGYVITDRPAYQPGQSVGVRAVLRDVEDGHYVFDAGQDVRVEVSDPRGRVFVRRDLPLSEFGTLHTRLDLDEFAPQGQYTVRCTMPSGSEHTGQFAVHTYQLQRIELTAKPVHDVVYRGETVEVEVTAAWYYGEPVARAPLQIQLPDGRLLDARTDERGRARFTFETRDFLQEQALSYQVSLVEEQVAERGQVFLAVHGYRARLDVRGPVHLAGDAIPVRVQTTTPDARPVSRELTLNLLRRESSGRGEWTEVLVREIPLRTGDDGVAERSVRLEQGGPYVFRVEGLDRFGHPVQAEQAVFVSGDEDQIKLRLLTDVTQVKVGETVQINALNRAGPGLALLTFEGEEILSYRILSLEAGSNVIPVEVLHDHFPSFAVSIAAIRDQSLWTAAADFQVRRDLNIELRPAPDPWTPDGKASVEVRVTDSVGRPVQAELSLAVIDEALLRVFPSPLQPIQDFFQRGRERTARMRTSSSCTFRYEGATRTISAALLEESRRAVRFAAQEDARTAAVERLQSLGYTSDKSPSAVTTPPAANTRLRAETGSLSFDHPAVGTGGGAGGRFGGRRGAGKQAEAPRMRFLETAFWRADLVTDAEGRARVEFTAPSQSTRWRLTALGVTRDSDVGQASTSVPSRADFFLTLRAPALVTEGDRPDFAVRVHNLTGQAGEAELTLRVDLEGAAPSRWVQTQRVAVPANGVVEHLFQRDTALPLLTGLRLQAEATATLGGADFQDALQQLVPGQPWGLEHTDSASGVLTADQTLWLELPGEHTYQTRDLQLFVGPGVERLLIEEALQRTPHLALARVLPPPPTQADSAAQLAGLCAVTDLLVRTGVRDVPEFGELLDAGRGLAQRLVAAQREDGGWSWAGRDSDSDPLTSSRALVALGRARQVGLVVPPDTVSRGVAYLQNAYQASPQQSHEQKAMLQYALAVHQRGDFAAANRLHRLRTSLTPAALAYTCLTLAEMGRQPMAADLATLLEAAVVTPAQNGAGEQSCYWPGHGNGAWNRSPLEMTALALLALQKAHPASPRIPLGVAYLLDHRPWGDASGGTILEALSYYHASVQRQTDRARVTIAVNDQPFEQIELDGAAPGRVLSVPARLLGDPNTTRAKVTLQLTGRGRPHYLATLTGFTRDVPEAADRDGSRESPSPFRVTVQEYHSAPPRYRGRAIDTGFETVQDVKNPWVNTVSALPLGALTDAHIEILRDSRSDTGPGETDYLVLEVPLPAGASVLADSVTGNFQSYEEQPGRLVFHVGPVRGRSRFDFRLAGTVPGDYRALPPRVRSAYDPSRSALGFARTLRVLPRDVASDDPYRPTPDELYHMGKAWYDDGEHEAAHALLQSLFEEWSDHLRDAPFKDTARMLLFLAIERRDAPAMVQAFELLKERDPSLTVPFQQMLVVGDAYRRLQEHERALLIFRAIAEETFLKDLQVAGTLEEQGERAGTLRTLQRLWYEAPDFPAVVESYLTLADKMLRWAEVDDPALVEAGFGPARLQVDGVLMLKRFLALYAGDPTAPEGALNLVSAYLNLEDYQTASTWAERFAGLYQEPRFQDAFQYTRAVADWSLGQDERAVEILGNIARAEYPDEAGRLHPSENRNLALYILGQIHHARRQPDRAIEYYQQVESEFADARQAIAEFREKDIAVEEVTRARPGSAVKLKVAWRNLPAAELLVYPVDLMTLYLREKNLSKITEVNLAGITPTVTRTIELGAGYTLQPQEKEIDLSLPEAGAYLVICRGEELHTSGLVLVSPLALEVSEDVGAGRLRIEVLDAAEDRYVKDVDVRVIGSANQEFVMGRTDPRGLFTADGIAGTSTVIARAGTDRYAFYRGTQVIAEASRDRATLEEAEDGLPPLEQQEYLRNVFELNRNAQDLREKNFRENTGAVRKGIQVQQVK